MPPTLLYLARHGRTAWNELGRFQGHTDIPLDDVGREQAARLAERLRGRVEAVVASDLQRAAETARIVCDVLGIPLLALDADLRERGYGVFEGLTQQECRERFPDAWAARLLDRNHEPPGGEPRATVHTRMQRALARALEALRDEHQHALIVGHGSALRMLLEVLTGASVASIGNMEYRRLRHDGGVYTVITD